MAEGAPAAVLSAILLVVLPGHALANSETRPWQGLVDELRQSMGTSTERLRDARALLLARAQEQDAALVARLTIDPPAARPPGYGILPEITADEAAKHGGWQETRYSLAQLAQRITKAGEATGSLLSVAANGELSLDALTVRFETLRDDQRNIESNLAYHDYWQQALVDQPAFFKQRNKVITLLREQRALAGRDADAAAHRIAELETLIRQHVNRFSPVAGLRILTDHDGTRRLPLTVYTDIDDEPFLATFRQAIESLWNASDAAQAARLRIELSLARVPPTMLYPEGPPAPGQAIDVRDHLGRFPRGALVLTTGARSTHAWTGRGVLLGPAPLTRRTLAHEFGHLLGFEDAYVRGYEGDPSDAYGAVLVEWTGLTDDLMGNPGGGATSPEMIARLIQAYGP